jgi:hypothetical protein
MHSVREEWRRTYASSGRGRSEAAGGGIDDGSTSGVYLYVLALFRLRLHTLSMSQPPIVLPISTVQTDFESLITDVRDGIVPEETFWVSCYKTGEDSVHGKARVVLSERNREIVEYEGQKGVQFHGDDLKVSMIMLRVSST